MVGTVRWGSLARVALLAAIWGSSFLWIKLALRGFSPVEVALVRIALGAATLLAISRVRGIGLPRGMGTWGHLTVAAFFNNALPYALFAFGEETVDSSVAGVINATTPLWTMLLAVLVGSGKRLGTGQVAGLFLGFAGVILILAPWQSAGAFGAGAAMIMIAAFSYAISYLYLERFLSGRGLDPIAMCGSQLAAATGLLLLVLPFSGDLAVHARPDAFAAIAILGVLGTGIAVVINYRLILDDGAAVASSVTYLLPLVSVLLGALALGEGFGLRMAVGIAVVLGGIALSQRTPKDDADADGGLADDAAAASGAGLSGEAALAGETAGEAAGDAHDARAGAPKQAVVGAGT
ncbi:DMT family transporter [Yinghuangia soli]|uniref:DMT family transporter n=1 Tax=Yinghuangia soli TaxID=2908204 RepID=A0AA41U2Q0_9ACTN|nr:DMT family transporter [Yinghuangia soli]MCF2532003.1 DMT family transporter [Yinghuangia soli]